MRKVNSCKRTSISLNRNKGTKDGTYVLSDIIIGQPLSSFRIPSTNHIRQQILFLNRVRTSIRYDYCTSLRWVSGPRKKKGHTLLSQIGHILNILRIFRRSTWHQCLHYTWAIGSCETFFEEFAHCESELWLAFSVE